jgi:sortase A
VRSLVRGIGEVLVTAGAVALLFLVYQLWWTTLLSNREAARNADEITQSWTAPNPALELPPELTEEPAEGTGFALMTIPRLGNNMNAKPVLQGVGLDVLAEGLGHYPTTAMPGQPGNFAVAGHRISYGEPFRNVPELQIGDNVYVETETYWYTYRLAKSEIVLPDAIWAVQPEPFGPELPLGDRLVTLTTCEPLYGNSHRWIWWGELVETMPKVEGAPTMTVSG